MKNFEILKNWQKQTGLTLEDTYYDTFIMENVNNYSAKTAENEYKRKGSFSLTKAGQSLRASVISEAIEKYINEGIPVAKTINSCSEIEKFCYSSKISKVFSAEYDGEESQLLNRFFITHPEKGAFLERINKDKKRGRIRKEKVILANNLTKKININLVNKNFYIKEAERRLTELLREKVSKELEHSNAKTVNELKKFGLIAIPKNFKSNIKGFSRASEIQLEYDFSIYPTIAALTGKKEGIIAVDIDVPEIVPVELMEAVLNAPGLLVYTKDRYINEIVLKKGQKFKVLYKYSGSEITQKAYLKEFGYEILYKKPANVAGAYDYIRDYHYEGEIIELPEKIKKILIQIQKIKQPKKKTGEVKPEIINNHLISDDFSSFIEQYLNKNGIEYAIKTTVSHSLRQMTHEEIAKIYAFECPFRDEHTNEGNSEVVVYVNKSEQIEVRCWHNSCYSSIKELKGDIDRKFEEYLTERASCKEFRLPKPAEEMTMEELLDCYE